MKILFAVLTFLLILILYVLFAKSIVEIEISPRGVSLKIKIGILKFKYYSKRKKSSKKEKSEEKSSEAESKIKSLKRSYDSNKKKINIFLKAMRYKIDFGKIKFYLKYGTGDAPSTGVLYGIIWGLLSNFYTILKVYFNADYPKVEIIPCFEKKEFDFKINGILKLRLVHIINALVKLLFTSEK